MERIRVLIVDDQVLFATSLRLVLENASPDAFEIVGLASNGRECVEMIDRLEPDMVLLDVYMPEMDGVEAAAIIHRRHPEIKIVMLTTFDDDAYVKKALRSGASGYLLKSIDAEEFVTCLKAANKGMMLMSSSIGSRIFGGEEAVRSGDTELKSLNVPVDARSSKIEAIQKRFPELKPRESEILHLILNGFNNHQIAADLLIAEQTVRNYTSAIYSKIGVDDRLQAIQLFASLR